MRSVFARGEMPGCATGNLLFKCKGLGWVVAPRLPGVGGYSVVMARWTVRVLAGFVVFCVLVFAVDWVVWRVVRGGATGTVAVTREVVAPLKGGREEYYFDGTTTERCSRSALPEGGMRACWWVERHRVVFDR